MKILVMGNGAIGNINGKYFIHKHTVSFAEELIELGSDVGFLQFEEMFQVNEGLQNSSFTKNISLYSIPLDNKGRVRKLFSYFKMIFFMIKTILKYDFIYIFYPGHVAIFGSLISILLRKKYGLYIRGQYNINTKLGNFIIKRAQFCLTVSDLLKDKLNNSNCDIIAPMIAFSKKDILMNREYSNDGIVRCLFVGRVELRKGIYDLMNAIKILNKEIDYLQFDIIGGGDSFNELKENMQEYSNVIFHGEISEKEELLNIYKGADLFIFPSHDEGFPRVLYEAMMARIPIVTTMVGGIGGLMKDNYNCLSIEAENADSIVRTVKKMINTKELKIRLVEQSTKDILKIFDGTRVKHAKLLNWRLYSEYR